MLKKKIKVILLVIVFTAIPSFLSYVANSTVFLEKLVEKGLIGASINIKEVKDSCLWIGIALSALLLSLNLAITKINLGAIIEQRNALIRMAKSLLTNSLGGNYLSNSSMVDIRIFIPKHPFLYKLSDMLKLTEIHKYFVIKNIDLIAEQGETKSLQFEVSPNPKGLVGSCYKLKHMVYDDDLEHTNGSELYNLDNIQLSRTSSLKWSICCPVFDKNNEVVAIIALDGKNKITINKVKETEMAKDLIVFSRMMYDHVPQLFKR